MPPHPCDRSARRAGGKFSFAFPVLSNLLLPNLLRPNRPTTVRRDVHHDVSHRCRNDQARSSAITRRKPVEPMKLIPLPPGLAEPQEDPVIQVGTVEPRPSDTLS